ncbi:hypothetical protein LCGC14_0264430 [marine sediment metagenome]|uniref:Uncharacterized protein n=1 Tax=marine sediment metagenome TaxID=412755 RepID=A0A0F9WLH4_9ZZZZ
MSLSGATGDVHLTAWGPHGAVWIQMWVADGTSNIAPSGTSVTCAICGVEQHDELLKYSLDEFADIWEDLADR